MAKIDQLILDRLARLEVDALLEGLEDPEMRKNPSFLEKVRKFLQQNRLNTDPDIPGVKLIQRHQIPDFPAEDNEIN